MVPPRYRGEPGLARLARMAGWFAEAGIADAGIYEKIINSIYLKLLFVIF
jgi:hypothetical protein